MLQNLVSVSELEEIREYAPKPRDFDAEEIVQVIIGPGSRQTTTHSVCSQEFIILLSTIDCNPIQKSFTTMILKSSLNSNVSPDITIASQTVDPILQDNFEGTHGYGNIQVSLCFKFNVQLLAEPGSEAELKEASKKADLFLHTAEVLFYI